MSGIVSWSGAAEMNDALIDNWNDRVGDDRVGDDRVEDDDIVYHLGDFSLKDRRYAQNVFRRLKDRIRVLGYHWHHDPA